MKIDNQLFDIVNSWQHPFICCYFMQTFFLITGVCTNWNKETKAFLFSQVKGLLLPAILFTFLMALPFSDYSELKSVVFNILFMGGVFWFISALLIAKLLYYILHRMGKRNLNVLILLLISFVGVGLNELNVIPNYYYHRHAFAMCIALGIGAMFRDRLNDRRVIACSWIIYPLTVLSCYWIFDRQIPWLTAIFRVTPMSWPFYIILSITGSIVLLSIARFIKSSPILELLGKNSLIIYFLNWNILEHFCTVYRPILEGADIMTTMKFSLLFGISTIAIGLLVSYIFSTTILKYLIGKF